MLNSIVKIKTYKNRKAFALSMVMIMVIILSILSFAIMQISLHAKMTALHTTQEMAARAAADSGIVQALGLMNKKLSSGTLDDSALPSSPTTYLPNSQANYTYTVKGDVDKSYEIVSVGSSLTRQKTITTGLKLQGLFEYAIFAEGGIELKNGTTIDGYNFGATDFPLQIGTNSIQDGAVNMKLGVTIEGDVVVGPEGDTDLVIDSKKEAVINGNTWALPVKQNLPDIIVPDDLLSAVSSGTITGGETITTDGKYDEVNIQGINQTVTIDGDVTLYIVGDFTLGNSCNILIVNKVGNSLTLYLGSNLIAKSDSTINNDTQEPKSLSIFGLPTCTSMDFLSKGAFYGTIYAPDAKVVIYNAMDIYGSIIANSFIQHVNANFYYDASLRIVTIDDVGVRFVVNSWQEN